MVCPANVKFKLENRYNSPLLVSATIVLDIVLGNVYRIAIVVSTSSVVRRGPRGYKILKSHKICSYVIN